MSKTLTLELPLEEEKKPAKKEKRRRRGSGHVYERGGTLWINGRRFRESAHTDKWGVATDFLHRRITEARDGIVRPGRISYESLRDDLYKDYETRKHKSLLRRAKDDKEKGYKKGDVYIGTVPALDEFFAGYVVEQITTEAIKRFIQKRQKESISNSGINGSLAALRRMFWLRVKEKKFPRNLVPNLPMLPKDQPRTDFLTMDDYKKLLAELREELRPLLTVAFYTVARKSELLKLRWADVDFQAGDDGFVVFRDTKNGTDRPVPLVVEARKTLEALRAAHPNSEFVFVRKDGRPVKNFRKAWELALERAGPKDKLFHGLRRGVTTNAEAGVPEQTAMAFTGHKDIATHRRYRQLMQTNLVNAAKALQSHMTKN